MLANIIVGIIILTFKAIAVKSYIKQRKRGGCGGGCAGCSMNCPSKNNNKKSE